jgi:hypothetical protein
MTSVREHGAGYAALKSRSSTSSARHLARHPARLCIVASHPVAKSATRVGQPAMKEFPDEPVMRSANTRSLRQAQGRPFDCGWASRWSAKPNPRSGMTRLEKVSALEQVPGFFVAAVFGFFQVRGEDDGGLVVGGEDGKDVPGVGGDDEGGEEVELVGSVDDVAGADGADIRVVAFVESALDLHAAEEAVVVCGDVVGSGFSPGLGDAEAAFDGGLEEAEFGPLAAEFGIEDVLASGAGLGMVVFGFD